MLWMSTINQSICSSLPVLINPASRNARYCMIMLEYSCQPSKEATKLIIAKQDPQGKFTKEKIQKQTSAQTDAIAQDLKLKSCQSTHFFKQNIHFWPKTWVYEIHIFPLSISVYQCEHQIVKSIDCNETVKHNI